jgi:hypothetical protein
MDAANREPGDLERELRTLGKNLGDILRAAWESDDRRRVPGEIATGLNEAAAALRTVAEELGRSETGRQLKQDVRELEERIHSGELESRIRDDLLQVLRTVNAELDRAGQTMGGQGSAPTSKEDPR